MNLEKSARQYIEQTWNNLPVNLGVIGAGDNTDRLAAVLFEVLTDDEAAVLRDRLSELLQEVNYRG